MKDRRPIALIVDLWKRGLPEGGFSMKSGGKYRTEATAWALTALSAAGEKAELLKSSRSCLAFNQLENGLVPYSADHPEAIWTTPLAILAWQGSDEFSFNRDKAIDFLLRSSGSHWTREPNASVGHDTALKGWPWTSELHSWVEPTALSIVALRATGYEMHERVRDAFLMLLDRQLIKGGWNYGNTTVFGKELYPMPETTGMALSSIAGMAPKKSVDKSLNYLRSKIEKARTPITLGWGVLALSAYGERPEGAEQLIVECLNQQKRYGTYDTAMLSLLILAYIAKDGIVNALKQSRP